MLYSAGRMEATFPSAFLTNTSVLVGFDLTEIMPTVNRATHTAPMIAVEALVLGMSTPKRVMRRKLLIKNIVQYRNRPILKERQKTPKVFVEFLI
jgi:hypothetical protein